jgi:hypothetical protein
MAWDLAYQHLILVGNNGLVVRIEGEDVTHFVSGSRQHLRAISMNPSDDTALIVGNTSTVLLWDECKFSRIEASTSENLRAVAWNPRGTVALITGNHGTLLKYSDGTIQKIGNCRANLRHVSWRPMTDQALITSNCFAEEFIPSPNLFNYNAETDTVIPLNEGRVDLMGVDWNPSGESALVVGYDVVRHNGFIAHCDRTALSPIAFQNRRVYPVTVAWDDLGDVAAIATATTQLGMSQGAIYLWDGEGLRLIYKNAEFFFSSVTWSREDGNLVGLASTATRTFSC